MNIIGLIPKLLIVELMYFSFFFYIFSVVKCFLKYSSKNINPNFKIYLEYIF